MRISERRSAQCSVSVRGMSTGGRTRMSRGPKGCVPIIRRGRWMCVCVGLGFRMEAFS